MPQLLEPQVLGVVPLHVLCWLPTGSVPPHWGCKESPVHVWVPDWFAHETLQGPQEPHTPATGPKLGFPPHVPLHPLLQVLFEQVVAAQVQLGLHRETPMAWALAVLVIWGLLTGSGLLVEKQLLAAALRQFWIVMVNTELTKLGGEGVVMLLAVPKNVTFVPAIRVPLVAAVLQLEAPRGSAMPGTYVSVHQLILLFKRE